MSQRMSYPHIYFSLTILAVKYFKIFRSYFYALPAHEHIIEKDQAIYLSMFSNQLS